MITGAGIVSHLIAALGFALLGGVLLWRRQQNFASLWLIAACFVTAGWAAMVAAAASYGPPFAGLVSPVETIRTAAWLGFLVSLLARSWRLDERLSSSFVIAVTMGFIVAAQLVFDLSDELFGLRVSASGTLTYLFVMARIATAAGGLVLVHNLYVNAAPENRWSLQLLSIGLAGFFGYDLNFYTLQVLGNLNENLFNVRGAVDALVVPLIALSARRNPLWKLQVSRQVAFHTLSLGAIGGYLILMVVAAYGLLWVGGDWGALLQIVFLFATIIAGAVVLFSARARAWLRVQISKNFFAYRYDYRREWLRFIATVSGAGRGQGELASRVVQAVCEIVESPGGQLYARNPDDGYEPAARWNVRDVGSARIDPDHPLIDFLGRRQRIVDLDELRAGEGDYGGMPPPPLGDGDGWLIVPLIHLDRLAGFIVVQRSIVKRDLNWEDFDLLRTVGQQAASYIAEASSQTALAEAAKFDEFNRRFAFIMHDIKNLVSQLSLVARNAERHADNPEFRADMVKTLQSSVGKMNDLLARLSQHHQSKADEVARIDLSEIVGTVVAAKRQIHPMLLMIGKGPALAVEADPGRLEQVFAHLLQNAIDASAADLPVEVALARSGSQARVDITDHGSGMSAAFLRDELFKPFHSTKAGGFGIGAFEAREIVRAAGGRLDVVSREGEGTMFTILLPLADEAMAAEMTA